MRALGRCTEPASFAIASPRTTTTPNPLVWTADFKDLLTKIIRTNQFLRYGQESMRHYTGGQRLRFKI